MREHLLKLPEKHGLGLHLIAGGGVCEVHCGAHRSRSPACIRKTEEQQPQRVQKQRGRPTPGSWTSYTKGLGTWTHHLACKKSRGGCSGGTQMQPVLGSGAGTGETRAADSQGFLCSGSPVWKNWKTVGKMHLMLSGLATAGCQLRE